MMIFERSAQPKCDHPMIDEWEMMDLHARFYVQSEIANHWLECKHDRPYTFFLIQKQFADYIDQNKHDPLRHCHYLLRLETYPSWAIQDPVRYKKYLARLSERDFTEEYEGKFIE